MININTSLLKTKNLLYVEDDAYTAEEMSFFLKDHVNKLYIASNGKEGLELFKKYSIDLVVTDIQMPVMDGISMINTIKTINKKIPIVITTAFNETNYLTEALNLGINKYILKPLNLQETLKTLVHLVDEFTTLDYNCYLDMQANVTDISPQFLEYLGYTKEELTGKSSFHFIKESDIARLIKEFSALKSASGIKNIRFFIKRKDGTFVEVLLSVSPVLREDGSIERIFCKIDCLDTFIHSGKKLEKAFRKEQSLKALIIIESKIARKITNEINTDAFFKNIIDIMKTFANCAYVFVLAKKEDQFRIVAQTQHPLLDIRKILGKEFTLSSANNSFCGRCQNLLDNQIAIIDDIKQIPPFENQDLFVSANIHSVVFLPIHSMGTKKIIGVLSLLFDKVYSISKDEINMFKNITETIALGIESIEIRLEKEQLIKKLEYQVNTDQLTRTTNRRRGFEILEQELERANRYKNMFSLIYLDIDNFKLINDKYGHTEGDRVLIQLCTIFQDMLRLPDILIRWGGEEFIIVLPETKLEGATTIAEKLRQKLEENTNFTASFGVTQYIANDSIDSLIIRADKNMYKAKSSGKNKVVYE